MIRSSRSPFSAALLRRPFHSTSLALSRPSRRPPSPRSQNPPPTQSSPTTRPSSSPSPRKSTLLALWQQSWLPLSGAALVAGLLGFYTIGVASATFFSSPACCSSSSSSSSSSAAALDESSIPYDAVPTGRPPALTGANADSFDKELNVPESLMGISRLRRKLVSQARGHVLEVAMGSGRNLQYYNWDGLSQLLRAAELLEQKKKDCKELTREQEDQLHREVYASVSPAQLRDGITSFTGLDISVDMLEVARRRLVESVPPMKSLAPIVKASTMTDHTGGQLSYLSDRLRLVHSDAHHPFPSTAVGSTRQQTTTKTPGGGSASTVKEKKYDTVIQTFGLCSVSNPIKVLQNLASAVEPDTGRILLLEHGMGWFGIVNGLLDRNSRKHFAKYGCWWNRDIEGLVRQAVAETPGLEVVRLERPNLLQLGTLVWVELKVTAPS